MNYPDPPNVDDPGVLPGTSSRPGRPAGVGGSASAPFPGGGAGGAGGSPGQQLDGASGAGDAAGAASGPLFGTHPHPYPAGTIRPSGEPAALDAAVRSAYDRWKAAYLVMGCGGHYVQAPGGTGATTRITNSQIHGLGMLITALLAGHDPEARVIFDGMVAVFKKFGSYLETTSARPGNANLMAYGFTAMCGTVEAPDAQTDGDQPLALALLAAHKIWGSAGPVDYLAQAQATLAAMKAYEMNPVSKAPLLGDWCSLPNQNAQTRNATHPADFAFDHFRSYFTATGDAFWMEAVDSVYRIVTGFQARHSPMTGLFPEYMFNTSTEPVPATPNYLGEPNSGAFTADALLTIFRFASDHVIAGATDPRGKAALARLNNWIQATTGGNPATIARGYRLDGTALAPGPAPEFEAAFAATAMVDASNQAWLDALWKRMSAPAMTNSFADTVRLLSMILVTGNWWVP